MHRSLSHIKLDQGYCRGIHTEFCFFVNELQKTHFPFPFKRLYAPVVQLPHLQPQSAQLPLETKTIDTKLSSIHDFGIDCWFSLSSCTVARSTDFMSKRSIRFSFGLPVILKMNCPKWLPKDLQGSYHLFNEISRAAVTFKWLTNRYLSEIKFDEPDLYVRILQMKSIWCSGLDRDWNICEFDWCVTFTYYTFSHPWALHFNFNLIFSKALHEIRL